MNELPRKQWRYRGLGRFVVGQSRSDGTFDIYRGANTLEGAKKARREIPHWTHAQIFDQAIEQYLPARPSLYPRPTSGS